MTESDWHNCRDPAAMLAFLGGRASRRKGMLFGVACCRRVERWMKDSRSRAAVAVAEAFADGRASSPRLADARNRAFEAYRAIGWEPPRPATATGLYLPQAAAAEAAYQVLCDPLRAAESAANVVAAEAVCTAAGASAAAHGDAGREFWERGECDAIWGVSRKRELADQCDLLRELLGNPWRPLAVNPDPVVEPVEMIAELIYEQGAFQRMGQLGDALKGAGCDDNEILEHCRRPGPHIRGCWVVDILLGKR